MKVEITAGGQAPYAHGELLGFGVATTDRGVVRIANRERLKHRTTVDVYIDGRLQMMATGGRDGPFLMVICDARG